MTSIKEIFILLAVMTQVSAIFYGKTAAPGEYPFVAALIINEATGNETATCTASIIDRSNLITAAHCFTTADENSHHTAIIGCVNLMTRSGCSEKTFSTYTIHESYHLNNQMEFDVAIVHLDSPIYNWTESTYFLRMPSDEVHIRTEIYTIAGWGQGCGCNEIFMLKYAKVTAINRGICKQKWLSSREKEITNFQFCARGKGLIDAGPGDSGGPLFSFDENGKGILHGVVSYGDECKEGALPGVYTNIFMMRTWIERNKKKSKSLIKTEV